MSKYAEEIIRRRTFAIISHPDAGKTTLTEKLLLYGGAIVNHFGKKRIEDFIDSCREIREIVDAVEAEQMTNKDNKSKNT